VLTVGPEAIVPGAVAAVERVVAAGRSIGRPPEGGVHDGVSLARRGTDEEAAAGAGVDVPAGLDCGAACAGSAAEPCAP
jgi:hypothetical protein